MIAGATQITLAGRRCTPPARARTCDNPAPIVNRTNTFLALLIVLAAFAVRAWTLGAQSIWFDEGWSWHLATLPLREMVDVTAGDRSPVLYYALLHGWILAAGRGEFAMRLISVLADSVTLAALIALARRLNGAPAALGAGLVYAIAPPAVWFAQEARMYAQVAALCTLSSLALCVWARTARLKHLLFSALTLAAAVHSHYYAIFLLPAHAVAVLAQSGSPHRSDGRFRFFANMRAVLRQLWRWTPAPLLVLALVAPWLLYARGGFAYDDGFAFPLNTIDGRMLEFARWFVTGGVPLAVTNTHWMTLGLASGLGLGALLTARRFRQTALLLALIALPLLAAAVAVRLFFPYRSVFHPRYLIFVVPALCMLFGAIGAAAPRHRLMALPAPLLLAVAWIPVLQGYFGNPALQRDDVRGAVAHVLEALEPGDAVVMSRDNFAVTYYLPPEARDRVMAAPDGLHGVLGSEQIVLDKLRALNPKRVRLLLWQDDVVDPQRFLESALRANGFQIGEYNFGQIRLPLYQLTVQPPQPTPLRARALPFATPDQRDAIALRRLWHSARAKAGDWLYLTLEWQIRAPLSKDYKVFVHGIAPDGALAFQQDKLPLNDLLPTRTWRPDAVYRDPYAIVLPADLPAGRYTLRVGWYEPQSGQRLISPEGDAVALGEVEIIR